MIKILIIIIWFFIYLQRIAKFFKKIIVNQNCGFKNLNYGQIKGITSVLKNLKVKVTE